MTEYQIELAARLWRQGHDTLHIAKQVCPTYRSVHGHTQGGEADVYNNIGRIKAEAREPVSIRISKSTS